MGSFIRNFWWRTRTNHGPKTPQEKMLIYLSKNRLIDYQDNTPTHIILKTDDLITEKTKNQKNLDVVLSGFIGSKGNSDIA